MSAKKSEKDILLAGELEFVTRCMGISASVDSHTASLFRQLILSITSEQPKRRLTEEQQLIFDLFAQGCQRNGIYDHDCISAYENAQAYLVRHEIIREDECGYKTR